MKKILIVFIMFIIICLSIWFQIGFLNSIPLSGVTANIGIVLIAGIGLISGDFVGAVTGAVYGSLIDIALGRGLGIYMALYALCGFVSGKLNNSFSKGNQLSMVMMIFICTILFETMAYLLNIILNRFDFSLKTLIINLILECAYNMLLTIMFFKPICFLGDILNKTKNSYYLL